MYVIFWIAGWVGRWALARQQDNLAVGRQYKKCLFFFV